MKVRSSFIITSGSTLRVRPEPTWSSSWKDWTDLGVRWYGSMPSNLWFDWDRTPVFRPSKAGRPRSPRSIACWRVASPTMTAVRSTTFISLTRSSLGAGINNITLDPATASTTEDFYNGITIKIVQGPGAGQVRTIIDYEASNFLAHVDQPWEVALTSNSVYKIKNDLDIIVHANSLGNRVAASGLDALQMHYPLHSVDTNMPIIYPRTRYVMGHPALNRDDLLPPVPAGTIRFDLQQQLLGISEYINNGHTEEVLMFYSPFDKPGAAFKLSMHLEMLGRCGLPTGYMIGNADVRVKAIFSESATDFHDIWHVQLMGWNLPEMYINSRPNLYLERGLYRLIGAGGLGKGSRIIHIKPQHIDPIWTKISDYVRTGNIPP